MRSPGNLSAGSEWSETTDVCVMVDEKGSGTDQGADIPKRHGSNNAVCCMIPASGADLSAPRFEKGKQERHVTDGQCHNRNGGFFSPSYSSC